MQGDFTAFRLNIWHFVRELTGPPKGRRWDWEGLSYPHWRIYWNRQPGARISYAGVDTPLDPDSVIVVAPHTPIDHHVTGCVENSSITAMLGYPYDRVAPRVDRVSVADLPMNLLEVALADTERDDDLAQHLGIRQTLSAHAFVCSVLSALPEEIWMKPPSSQSIRDLTDEILRHPEAAYRTTDMAERCHMSVNTLLRRFQEQVGQTPRQFITESRLQKACALLLQTSYSIERIAEACGYKNRYYFSKVFADHYRCGPATFRRHPTRLRTWKKGLN